MKAASRAFSVGVALLFLASAASAQYRIAYVDAATVLEEDHAHPEMTWYWPSFWQTSNGALHFLAHGGDGYAGAHVYTYPEYRCGFKVPGIDSFYGATLPAGGQWQTPANESCPAFFGEYQRCGYTPQRTERLDPVDPDPACPPEAGDLCNRLYAPIGPVGSPSVLRIDHNNQTRYFMAYSGGNGDYIPGGIYWALGDEDGSWRKYPADGNGPILYSKYWDCEWTGDPVHVVERSVGPVCSRRWPFTAHGLTTVDIVYAENDHGDGSNVDGTIYFFTGYVHVYRRRLHPGDDPKACPEECLTDCENVVINDSLVYRINYDPTSASGLGSKREIFMRDDADGIKKWMHHSGALVWDYDLSEFGEAATNDPILHPQSSTNIFPGNIDVKWNPDTQRWLSIGYFGNTAFGSLSNHKTQENASLAAADQWTGGPSAAPNSRCTGTSPDCLEPVEISELEKAFPSEYILDGQSTYIQYGGGLWYGTLGDKRGMWYFVPVRKRQYGPTTGPFVGLGIVPTLLQQCAYSMGQYERGQHVTVPPAGQIVNIPLTTTPGCAWTVEASNWIDKNIASGSGSHNISLTIHPNPFGKRELIASIAGRSIFFEQDVCAPTAACGTCTLRHHAAIPPPPPPPMPPGSSGSGFDISVTLDPDEVGVTAVWFAKDSQSEGPIGTGLQIHVTPHEATKYWALLTQACSTPRTDTTDPITLSPSGIVPQTDLGLVMNVGGIPKTYDVLPSTPGHPSSQVVSVLSAPITGELNTYEWWAGDHYNDSGQPLGTGSVYSATGPGVYWFRVTNSAGIKTNSAVTRLVTAPADPPDAARLVAVSVFPGPGTVIGTAATVALTTIFPNPPFGTTYQWRQATERDGILSKEPTSPVLNTDASNWVFRPTGITGHVAYWVRVITPDGLTHDSDPVLLTVSCDREPFVTIQLNPNDVYVPSGRNITLFTAGFGRNLSYLWYQGNHGDTSHLIGSVGPSVNVFSPDGPYWVRATDDCGHSADAAITLYSCKPTISENGSPQDAWIASSGTEHRTATLTVSATPARPTQTLYYQWYAGNSIWPIAGANSSTYVADHAGTYFATVSADCGEPGSNQVRTGVQSAPATVLACTPPVLGVPSSRDVRLGDPQVLSVSATGDALTYQWCQGASAITSSPIAGATTDHINVQPNVDSDYWARVTDHGVCVSDSATIHLTVCYPPAIASQPAGSSVFSGNTATLTVAATPATSAPLHYTWYEVTADGNQIPVNGNDSSSFTTPALTTSRSWFVRVFSGDQRLFSTDSQLATVHVCDLPEVHWASAPHPLRAGESFTLQISAPPAGSMLTWYQGTSGDVAHSTLLSGPSDIYTYYQVTPQTPTSTYWARVTKDACYADSSTLTLNVCVPTITQQPSASSVNAGASVTLSVAATTSNLTYQWYMGEKGDTTDLIAGATSAQYIATPSADTSYWVRVTGSCAVSADSDAALVTVCHAPAITSTSPVTQATILGTGSTTSLWVAATGNNLTYQWYIGTSGNTASPIGSGTSNVLNVQPQNTTSYWVRVSGSCGPSKDSVTLLVTVCATPSITAQPQGSIIFSGGTATMSVTSTEATTTPMSYQWYRGAAGDVSAPVGSNSASFTTPPLTTPTSYWVRISCGVCAPVDSQVATVSMCYNPQVLSAPADQFIAIGQTATLTAPCCGNTYQWYYGASGNTSQPASGPLTVSTLNVAPVVTRQYWAQVTNNGCVSRTQSANVNVCVPTITQQPGSLMINPGASTTLSVAANTPGLTYQWYIGASGTTTSPISGQTSATLTVTPANTTNYWVRVTGNCSRFTDSNTATVTICAIPAITSTGPVTQSSIAGSNSSTSFWVNATGSNLTYQWYYGTSGNTASPIAAGTSSVLSVSPMPQNPTNYWVRVSGACGTPVNSVTMLLNVCANPSITAQPQGTIIFSGSSATLTVNATESTTQAVTYQWYRGNAGDVSAPVGTNSPSFTTPALTTPTTYWVRVSCGICAPADSQAATVSICNNPQVLSAPADQYIAIGQTATLTAPCCGNTYQWYYGASGNTSQVASGQLTVSTLSVTPASTTQYWAQVTNNGCLSRTLSATVYVCVPTFTQQPASVTISPGSSTTLSASANTPGVTYQWYTGSSGNTSAPIGGATGPTVTVTPSASTSYWVRATGSCGRTTDSVTATVTLCSAPVITGQPYDFALHGAGNATLTVWATGSNLTYQWFYGNSGDTSTALTGVSSSNTTTAYISATQRVWARVTGQCGTANSNSVWASIYPTIYQQPAAALTVGYNSTASTTVYATGNYLHYVWKWGNGTVVPGAPDSPALITPSIVSDTSVYCEVWSGAAMTASYETAITVCYTGQPAIYSLQTYNNGSCRIAQISTSNNIYDIQWYQGARGDVSHLVSSGSTALYVCPTVPTQYWCRVVGATPDGYAGCYNDSVAITLP